MKNWAVCWVLGFSLLLASGAAALESPQTIGWFCNPTTTSILNGQRYIPGSGTCTYKSPTITGPRYGDLYRGVVGSSTIVSGHFLGSQSFSTQSGDTIGNPVPDENFFAAIYPANLVSEFRKYFQTGVGETATSTTNFGFIRFIYGEPLSDESEIIDPVIIIPGILGSEKNSNGEWVIDPILHTYDDLIATLDINYYTPNVDLFTFPYDWRKSNVETALLLKEKIDEIKGICDCGKVDLVAHSMGGLVARQYIQSEAYDQDIDQLIFLGTPHLGAPKAYLMWEGGQVGPTELSQPLRSILDEIAERTLEHEAHEMGYSTLFEYLRTEPIESVRQLLPVYDYLFDGNQLRDYPNNYPINSFLEELNRGIENLVNAGIEIHNIIGETEVPSTINGISVMESTEYLPKWQHGYPDGFNLPLGNHGIIHSFGDKTVPLASASFVNSNLLKLPYEHGPIVSASQGDVYKILTGQEAIFLSNDNTGIDVELLLIKMLSPADLFVIAPDGRKIGKENGQSLNQIPGAFYTGFNTEVEFITIVNPLDGQYKISTQGTGSGSYTVETNYIDETKTTIASYTGATSLNAVEDLELNIDTLNPDNISIQASDTDPPVITIAEPSAQDYLRSGQLSVSASATDVSGLAEMETKFGTTTIPSVGTIDLFFKNLGVHTITVSARDIFGNATTSLRTFRVIANATSTVADLERAYTLGWMTKTVHDELLKKMKAIVVLKKTIKNITETVVETGRNGKKTTKNVQKKTEIVERVLDKAAAKAILKELDKYRGKGLDERAYQLLKGDIQWLINN